MLEALYDEENLHKAFKKVCKASGWKERTQRYAEDRLFNLTALRDELIDGTWRPKKPWTFIICERGKMRAIESYAMEDRIVQTCLVQYVLLPVVRPKLIYDNDASLTKRGTSHFRKRLTYKLRQFAKEHGNNGYVLIGDFSKYFDNIVHSVLVQTFREMGVEEDVLEFVAMLLKAHETDVSHMTEYEYAVCIDTVFDTISYQKIDKSLLNGSKLMAKGTGIGSPLAQLAGVAVPYKIDNYVKIVMGVKAYGRYNDDFYVLHESKEFLERLLEGIERICIEQGIHLNKKKTQIIPLRKRFSILKTQYWIKDNGVVIELPSKKSYIEGRKRIRGLSRCYQREEISFEKVQQMYRSRRESLAKRKGTTKSIASLDQYFESKFGRAYNERIEKPEVKRTEIFDW